MKKLIIKNSKVIQTKEGHSFVEGEVYGHQRFEDGTLTVLQLRADKNGTPYAKYHKGSEEVLQKVEMS